MGLKSVVSVLVLSVFLAIVYQKFHNITKPLKGPKLNLQAYWGAGNERNYREDAAIHAKNIHYDNSVIDSLKKKLNETVWLPDPLEGVRYEYGINSNELANYIDYWRDDYLDRWSEREELFNSLPHYTTQIQGYVAHATFYLLFSASAVQAKLWSRDEY